MTKEITELLQWLHKTIKNIEGEVSTKELGMWKSWATAVEQQDKQIQQLLRLNIEFSSKVQAYERILDKGMIIKVNPETIDRLVESYLYYVRESIPDKALGVKGVMNDLVVQQKDLIKSVPTIDFGESEDKVEKP